MRILNSMRPSPIGLVVTSAAMAAAQARRTRSGWQLSAAGTLPRSQPSGEQLTQEEADRLQRFLTRRGFVGRRVVASVPQRCLHMAVLDSPSRDSGAPVDDIAAAELARMHGYPPEDAETLCQDLPPSPRSKGASQLFAMSCAHEDAEKLMDSIAQAGLDVVALDSRPTALRRACVMAGSWSHAAVLEMEPAGATMLFLHHGTIVYVRFLPQAGLDPLKTRLADRLGLTPQASDCLLCGAGSLQAEAETNHHADVSATIRAHLDHTIDEWRVPAAYVAQTYPDFTTEQLWLVGAGAGIRGAEQHLQEQSGFSVQVLRPASLLDCAEAVADCADDPRLTAAVALACYEEEDA